MFPERLPFEGLQTIISLGAMASFIRYAIVVESRNFLITAIAKVLYLTFATHHYGAHSWNSNNNSNRQSVKYLFTLWTK